MAQPFCLVRGEQHGFLRAQRAHVEHERVAMRGDLLGLALVLRHNGGAACGEDDIRAVVHSHVVGDRMHHRARSQGILYNLFQLVRHRSAPSSWLNTWVRLSAASTITEIAAPTAVDTRKDGTKVNSAAAELFIRTAAIG